MKQAPCEAWNYGCIILSGDFVIYVTHLPTLYVLYVIWNRIFADTNAKASASAAGLVIKRSIFPHGVE
jgi:hypothetical protein